MRVTKRVRRSSGGRRLRKAQRPKRYHHGALRHALVEAALWLVEKGGYQALTLRAAARRAGVSQAAPYRHFKNKEALLAAVAEEGFRAMAAAMRHATASCGDRALERLQAVGLGYVGFATSHPSHFRVMFGREMADRSTYPTLREAAAKTSHMLVDAITDCQRAGVVRSGEPEELALACWAIVHGVAALLVDGQVARVLDKPGAELAEIVTRNLCLGLGPRPEKDPARSQP